MKSFFLQNLSWSSGNRVKAYKSTDEFMKGVLQGSEHGGVDAVIDELPFVQPLLRDFIKDSNDDQLRIKKHLWRFWIRKYSHLFPFRKKQWLGKPRLLVQI